MDRFIDAADRHSPELGVDIKNKVQAMLAHFKSAREEQLLKKQRLKTAEL